MEHVHYYCATTAAQVFMTSWVLLGSAKSANHLAYLSCVHSVRLFRLSKANKLFVTSPSPLLSLPSATKRTLPEAAESWAATSCLRCSDIGRFPHPVPRTNGQSGKISAWTVSGWSVSSHEPAKPLKRTPGLCPNKSMLIEHFYSPQRSKGRM